MPTISLIGPGAIGGTIASFLLENPSNTVTLCARTPFETLTITSQGQSRSHQPKIHTKPDSADSVDWIILATKTYQIEQAAAWFPALSTPRTRIAVIQNGVEHISNLAPYFQLEKIVPVIIDCPAEKRERGQITRHGDVKIDIPTGQYANEFSELFDDPSVSVNITADWTTAAWKKLCINCAGAISALVNQPANIASDSRAALVMENLIRECIEVGKAEGADLSESIIPQIISSAANAPEGSMNSLHADLVGRRPMEWDARNGVIVRIGKKHGIATPCNALATQLLSLLESQSIAQG